MRKPLCRRMCQHLWLRRYVQTRLRQHHHCLLLQLGRPHHRVFLQTGTEPIIERFIIIVCAFESRHQVGQVFLV